MTHDPTKVLMGTTRSSHREGASAFVGDPATYKAGLAVRQSSTSGTLALAKASGGWLGISLGKDLSDSKKTSVLRAGSLVPVLLTDDEDDYAYVVVGQKVYFDDVTGMANVADDGSVTTTISDAVFVSGVLTGVQEDGTEVSVALVDMPGGL